MKYLKNILLFMFLICVILISNGCKVEKVSDEDNIMELYAEIIKSFENKDIKTSMQFISKEFESNVKDQSNYTEVYLYRQSLFRNENILSVDIRDLKVELQEKKAVVSYDFHLKLFNRQKNWSEIDTLIREDGEWKIVTWKILGDI
ncbi:nuclear transport factor 2 family protein [candidate division KSB1 bacterium]